ncbi:MAG TPA: hypothetical protein VFL72_06355 [Acidimicrobiia bacterium]|nr:hypothetical protein [Acidimicrobiia bacterium]
MRWVLLFTVGYMVALFVYGHSVDSPLTNIYTGINLLLIGVFALIHRWARFPIPVLWGASLVGLGNMLGGVLLVGGQSLYMAEVIGPLRYDKFFHATAALVLFFVAWAATERWAGEGYHYGGMVLLTFLVTMGGGAVVEIAELIGSTLSDVSVGDYANNAFDLVANAVGALIGVVLLLLIGRPESGHEASTPG